MPSPIATTRAEAGDDRAVVQVVARAGGIRANGMVYRTVTIRSTCRRASRQAHALDSAAGASAGQCEGARFDDRLQCRCATRRMPRRARAAPRSCRRGRPGSSPAASRDGRARRAGCALQQVAAERAAIARTRCAAGCSRCIGCDETVAARHVVALGAVGAEQAIEDDQHAAVVGIEVLEVRGVVHAMGRRRVQQVFEPAELRDPRRVDPELVQQVEREHLEHDAAAESRARSAARRTPCCRSAGSARRCGRRRQRFSSFDEWCTAWLHQNQRTRCAARWNQ